jgi:hypothetical protein
MQQRDKGDLKTAIEDYRDSSEIRDAVISGCLAACFQTLLDASGPEETIQAVGRYSRHSGMALAHNARKRFGFSGNGFEEAGIPYLWAYTAVSNRQAAMEVYEHGVIVSCKDCPMKVAAPELCVAHSHNVVKGICETINPNLVSIFTDHLTDGGSICRFVITKASEPSINGMGQLVKEVRLTELPEEEVSALRAHFISEMLNTTMKAFVDLHGSEKTLELAKTPAHIAGLSLGKQFTQELGFEKGNFAEVESCISTLCKVLGQEGTINESVNRQFIGETVECPLKSSPPEVCELLETFKGGMVASIDPDSELVFDRMMTKGDKSCHWTIRKRGKALTTGPEIRSFSEKEEMLKSLKWRLVRGEISKMEYEELRRLVQE